ncbi:YncE family protein [Cytobacillus sp. Hm23]
MERLYIYNLYPSLLFSSSIIVFTIYVWIFAIEGWTNKYNATKMSKTHSVIANTIVGQTPLNLDITQDGKLIYVVNGPDQSVSVIDVKTHSVIATIQVDFFPGFVVFTPDGKLAYVSASPPA